MGYLPRLPAFAIVPAKESPKLCFDLLDEKLNVSRSRSEFLLQ